MLTYSTPSELISKRSALNCFHDWIDRYGDIHFANETKEYQAIEHLPTKRGRWINIPKYFSLFEQRIFCCSECGNTLDFDGVNAGRGDANFCPNCGAYMKGE